VKRNGWSLEVPKQGEPVADEKLQEEPKQEARAETKERSETRRGGAGDARSGLEQANAHPSALSSRGKYASKELGAPQPKGILQLPPPIVA
jgi:hypothetical protein